MQKQVDESDIVFADYLYKDRSGLQVFPDPYRGIFMKFHDGVSQAEKDQVFELYGLTDIEERRGEWLTAIAPPKTNVWSLADEIYGNTLVRNAYPVFIGSAHAQVQDEYKPDFVISVSPNPANPVATINYSIPHDSEVLIDVFSITGQRIANLVDGFKQAGSHTVVFDGSSLSSGVYFYRVSAGRLARTGKITLVK